MNKLSLFFSASLLSLSVEATNIQDSTQKCIDNTLDVPNITHLNFNTSEDKLDFLGMNKEDYQKFISTFKINLSKNLSTIQSSEDLIFLEWTPITIIKYNEFEEKIYSTYKQYSTKDNLEADIVINYLLNFIAGITQPVNWFKIGDFPIYTEIRWKNTYTQNMNEFDFLLELFNLSIKEVSSKGYHLTFFENLYIAQNNNLIELGWSYDPNLNTVKVNIALSNNVTEFTWTLFNEFTHMIQLQFFKEKNCFNYKEISNLWDVLSKPKNYQEVTEYLSDTVSIQINENEIGRILSNKDQQINSAYHFSYRVLNELLEKHNISIITPEIKLEEWINYQKTLYKWYSQQIPKDIIEQIQADMYELWKKLIQLTLERK